MHLRSKIFGLRLQDVVRNYSEQTAIEKLTIN